MSYEAKLEEMGYKIEPVELDNGIFLSAVQTGNLIFTSGQLPIWGDKAIKGTIGDDLGVEEGYEAAIYCTLNGLRAIKTLCSNLEKINKIIKVFGMVNTAPGFNNTPEVIHGCSDILREVFGETGFHTRSAVGMTLPFGFAVEIEMIVEVMSD